MVDGFNLVCPACGRQRDLSLGLRPNEDGQLICAGCGAEIPIPLATPDDSLGDTTTSRADMATFVDPQHKRRPAGTDTIESELLDCGSGRYAQKDTIGKGGMGEIILCVEHNVRREVAMKRLLPTAAKHARQRARFVQEAQVTGQLEHPNIVPIHELGRDEQGAIYFTMKLVKGRSLSEILAAARDGEGTHSLAELLGIFLKVCDGVAFAHSRGVVHRDLKPANIMVGDFGEVLVMDWGIARILGRDEIAGEDGDRVVQSPRQDTNAPALHTMAGSVMGSPQYMPPEQAAGEIDTIDHRSDIYALGAILYNILTLKSPFEGRDPRATIDKVVKGSITPPEKRAPDRDIPRELSAVAMKCLARFRGRRYQSVPDLQRDVTLYLEGRSVSAAPDTFAQALVKLVKRNKAVSVSIAAAAVILITVVSVAFVRVSDERDVAITERQAAREARDEQRATALAASQELAERAVRAADQERWVEADISAVAARKMLPDCPWGHYAAGMVALARKDRQAARIELKRALACDPAHALSKAALGRIAALEGRLVEAAGLLGDPGKSKDWHVFRAAGDTFTSQQRYRDAETTYARALELLTQPQRLGDDQKDWRALVAMGDAFGAQEFYADAVAAYERAKEQMAGAEAVPPKVPNQVDEKLRQTRRASAAIRAELQYRKGSATAWVKCEGFYESIRDLGAREQGAAIAAKLTDILGADAGFRYDIEDRVLVGVHFYPRARKVVYIQPLAGLPLVRASLYHTYVRDLGPLKGMPLRHLSINRTYVSDLSPLRGMPLRTLHMAGCPRLSDLGPLKGMPLTYLAFSDTRISSLRPLEGMPLKELHCSSSDVQDLGPLKGMPLKGLNCSHTEVSDLSPLKGMPLEELNCSHTEISDLSPLKGIPLEELNCGHTEVSDLTPLKGMSLKTLYLHNSKVTDLTFLKGMPLTYLHIGGTKVTDLTPLKSMPLKTLIIHATKVTDLTLLKRIPLTSLNLAGCSLLESLKGIEGMLLERLDVRGTPVSDLAPLKGMKLEVFLFTPKNITKGIEIIRGMKSIREIGRDDKHLRKPEEFWKKYDAGEFK